MIKINLLGAETTSDTSGALQVFIYGLSLVVALIVCTLVYSFDKSAVGKLENETGVLKSQLGKLKEQTKEVRDLEAKRQELKQTAGAIGKLKLIQVGPVKILSAISDTLPTKAWIREIADKDGVIELSGIALDDFSVSTFLKNLQSIDIFKSIDLGISATVKLVQVAAFNAFESSLVRYVVPADERKSMMSDLKKEAEKQGLQAKEEQPARDDWKKGASAQGSLRQQGISNRFNAPETSSQKLLGFGVRTNVKDPTLYIWSSLEETEGKAFKILITTDFLKPEGLMTQAEDASSEVAPKGGKASKAPASAPSPFIPSRG